MSYYDVTLCVLTEIVGDFGFKEFANKGGIRPFTIGVIGYIGVIYYLIRSLQGSTVLMVNAAWDGISAIVESLAAFIILGERLKDISQYFGIIFIIIGLFLLHLFTFQTPIFTALKKIKKCKINIDGLTFSSSLWLVKK